MMDISETLKQARTDAKLSQEAAAEKAGVSRQTMSNWENGKSYPDIASVITLSDVYNVSLDSLLKGDKTLIEHLKESADVKKSRTQIVSIIISALLFLICPWFLIKALNGDIANFISIPTWLSILLPLLFVLTVTRKFKLLFQGFAAAFFPRQQLTNELYAEAAALFKLMSKTAALAAGLVVLICLINMLFGLDFNDPYALNPIGVNLAATFVTPFSSLILILFIFEPAAFLLKSKSKRA